MLAGLTWHLNQRHQEQERLYRQLTWSLRRPDEGERLTSAQRAYLQGDFVESLRQLGKPSSTADKELQTSLFLCILFDLPWPQQLLASAQLESSSGGRPRLLARVVQSGYAGESDRVRLDLLGWNGQRLEDLKPELKSTSSLGKNDDWATLEDLTTVHLDRKDTKQSQLWVAGKTRSGRSRLEVVYGFSRWQRWVLVTDKPARRHTDKVFVSGSQAYKLVDDEWIEVR